MFSRFLVCDVAGFVGEGCRAENVPAHGESARYAIRTAALVDRQPGLALFRRGHQARAVAGRQRLDQLDHVLERPGHLDIFERDLEFGLAQFDVPLLAFDRDRLVFPPVIFLPFHRVRPGEDLNLGAVGVALALFQRAAQRSELHVKMQKRQGLGFAENAFPELETLGRELFEIPVQASSHGGIVAVRVQPREFRQVLGQVCIATLRDADGVRFAGSLPFLAQVRLTCTHMLRETTPRLLHENVGAAIGDLVKRDALFVALRGKAEVATIREGDFFDRLHGRLDGPLLRDLFRDGDLEFGLPQLHVPLLARGFVTTHLDSCRA